MELTNEPVNPVDLMLPAIAQAVAEWKGKNTEQHIKQTVMAELDKEAKQVVLKLLGFKPDYPRGYELDHCNGRAGNSSAGVYICEQQKAAVQEWLSTVAMPALTEAERKPIIATCQAEYRRYFTDAVRSRIKAQADNDARELVAQLTKSKHIDLHLELQKLITGTVE